MAGKASRCVLTRQDTAMGSDTEHRLFEKKGKVKGMTHMDSRTEFPIRRLIAKPWHLGVCEQEDRL